jgi:hypothetical protein
MIQLVKISARDLSPADTGPGRPIPDAERRQSESRVTVTSPRGRAALDRFMATGPRS